ncbi:hypothetical protein SNOG_16097 [Parastagonospora nodorum SN15]|uniref:Uncharacterized protein n=1 Tax=Phaeosphaeria nodorum (strain SN15 / ATCC MYA-4574 / FGSC 10173) TaxID=321614 RepID=Q0TWG0_PHANO|nr:hypothetical protein SNOG_16097 [Parastagonospora nodorum SN15]EAT76469.1 hypothetical protein SNOG_16097 [Parastagonospora nodorum SN15]
MAFRPDAHATCSSPARRAFCQQRLHHAVLPSSLQPYSTRDMVETKHPSQGSPCPNRAPIPTSSTSQPALG